MQELSRKNKLFTDSVIRRMTRIAIANNAINQIGRASCRERV